MTRAIVLVPAPDFPEPWNWAFDVEAAALAKGAFMVEARPWNELGADTGDIVLPLVAWGYHARFAQWHAMLDRLEAEGTTVANPVPVLRWNSDKKYLVELGERGIPTIPTLYVPSLDEAALRIARADFGDQLVIKPPVSAAADGTFRLSSREEIPAEALGKPMMIQPFLPSVADEGEYSLLLFDGAFSHAVVKRPMSGDYRVQPHLGGREEACAPPPGALDLAMQALAAAPAATTYARVDLIRGLDGDLKVIELELIEPSLWLEHAPDGGASFVAAVAKSARQ